MDSRGGSVFLCPGNSTCVTDIGRSVRVSRKLGRVGRSVRVSRKLNLSASDERAGADVRQERRDEAVMKTL